MNEKDKEIMLKKALKAMANEDLECFVDQKNISAEDLKKALLTAVDIDMLQHEHQVIQKNKIKEI